MNVRDETIAKISELPEEILQKVNDFIDFLMLRRDAETARRSAYAGQQTQLKATDIVAESDFYDYLSNFEAYEEQLARGEIQW